MRMIEGEPRGEGRRIGVVLSRYNEVIGLGLWEGCRKALLGCGVAEKEMIAVRVPGAWEIPPAAAKLAPHVDGLIVLGAVIRGETTHHEHIGREVIGQLARLQEKTGKPVALGLLTVETLEQALERSKPGKGNKGLEAALHLLEALDLLKRLEESWAGNEK